jgi:hydrogenase expression/formation protein HypD
MAVKLAKQQGVKNFSVLVSHVLVPPAIEAIMNSPSNRVQAFLAAGHVCSVMGYWQYPPLSQRYNIPIVITGFEPLDILDGIRHAVLQLEAGTSNVENSFHRVVTLEGNKPAQAVINEVFEVTDRAWRGIGVIPNSGWRLRAAYRDLDAETRFTVSNIRSCESTLCRSGEVLQGAIKPRECEAFGKQCTPRTPLGATMVSSEGACAAYYNYGRLVGKEATI